MILYYILPIIKIIYIFIYLLKHYSTEIVLGYFEDNIVLHFASSMTSGAITTVASLPVDIAKTRYEYNTIELKY